MTRNIVASLPLASCCFTSHSRQQLFHAAVAHGNLSLRQLAFATGPVETAVNNRRAKEPLCYYEPPARGGSPTDSRADSPRQNDGGRRIAGGLHEERKDECKGDPSPASLHKYYVEDIVLPGKIARRDARVLMVRLRHVVIRRGSYVGRDDGEDGAEEEDGGEDG